MNSSMIRRMVQTLFGSPPLRSCRSSGWAAEVLEERALPSPSPATPLVLDGAPEVQQIAALSPAQPALTKPVAAVVPASAPSAPAATSQASTIPQSASLAGNGVPPGASATTNAAGAAVVLPIGAAPGSPNSSFGAPLFPAFGVSQVPVVNPGSTAAAPVAATPLGSPMIGSLLVDGVFAGDRDWMQQ